MIVFIKELFIKYRERRLFKKHDVTSWYQYHRKTDPDINATGDTLQEIYHGYHSFFLVSSPTSWGMMGPWPCSKQINAWCNENSQVRCQLDILPLAYINNKLVPSPNGQSEIMVAFKEKSDSVSYVMLFTGSTDNQRAPIPSHVK